MSNSDYFEYLCEKKWGVDDWLFHGCFPRPVSDSVPQENPWVYPNATVKREKQFRTHHNWVVATQIFLEFSPQKLGKCCPF